MLHHQLPYVIVLHDHADIHVAVLHREMKLHASELGRMEIELHLHAAQLPQRIHMIADLVVDLIHGRWRRNRCMGEIACAEGWLALLAAATELAALDVLSCTVSALAGSSSIGPLVAFASTFNAAFAGTADSAGGAAAGTSRWSAAIERASFVSAGCELNAGASVGFSVAPTLLVA